MDNRDRQLFQENWIGLLETIQIPPLLPHLVKSTIFTKNMIEEFTTRSLTSADQKRKLLQMVTKRGPNAKTKFVECLVAAGLYDAARLLQNDIQIPDPDQRLECQESLPIKEVKVIKAVTLNGGTQSIIGAYKMTSHPRGVALIFICKDFVNDIFPVREGAEKDCLYLNKLFTEFGYDVKIFLNKDKTETEVILGEWQNNPVLQTVDSLVIAFSSHGESGIIFAADGGRLNEREVFKLFNNEQCPFMNGKPKVFIIQACRGKNLDNGVLYPDATDGKIDTAAGGTALPQFVKPYSPSWTDMFIIHSTVPGYVSHRHYLSGSWLIEIFTRVAMENAWNMHLYDMILMVTKELHRRCTSEGEKQTPDSNHIGCTKHLYFNPGL